MLVYDCRDAMPPGCFLHTKSLLGRRQSLVLMQRMGCVSSFPRFFDIGTAPDTNYLTPARSVSSLKDVIILTVFALSPAVIREYRGDQPCALERCRGSAPSVLGQISNLVTRWTRPCALIRISVQCVRAKA